jgi:NAD(P)-dependent dehydrogenase (short-subunit alcohol dehydrogenase family)
MEKIFETKVALITGGSYGIGKATAIAFAKRGCKIVIADWIQDPNCETIKAIEAMGGSVLFIKCDVSKDNEVKAMIDKIISVYGRLDFAFNNAGIEGASAPTHECTDENWEKVISVNLTGVWLCMKHEIVQMLKQGKGAIVNNASIAGLVGFQNIPAYVASKHGVIGLTRNAALEYAKSGIRVNVICPGVIKTPMIDRFTGKSKEVEKQFETMEPIGRLGDPAEVAETVVWLCSDSSSFITGDAIPIDGGWVAQ